VFQRGAATLARWAWPDKAKANVGWGAIEVSGRPEVFLRRIKLSPWGQTILKGIGSWQYLSLAGV
jgi:hypothetical protein